MKIFEYIDYSVAPLGALLIVAFAKFVLWMSENGSPWVG